MREIQSLGKGKSSSQKPKVIEVSETNAKHGQPSTSKSQDTRYKKYLILAKTSSHLIQETDGVPNSHRALCISMYPAGTRIDTSERSTHSWLVPGGEPQYKGSPWICQWIVCNHIESSCCQKSGITLHNTSEVLSLYSRSKEST